MSDLTKDQLAEAYQTARSLGNALKAFRDVETLILTALDAKKSIERDTALAAQAKAEAADLVGKRDAARSEFDQEATRLAQFRKGEMAKIQAELATARDDADRKISGFQAEIADAKQASEEARKEHAGLLASLDAEIAATQGVLTKLQGEIDALKLKFS